MIHLGLLIAACVFFLVGAFWTPPDNRFNVVSAGLFCFALAQLVT